MPMSAISSLWRFLRLEGHLSGVPMAHRAGIDMDEIIVGVIAYPTHLERHWGMLVLSQYDPSSDSRSRNLFCSGWN